MAGKDMMVNNQFIFQTGGSRWLQFQQPRTIFQTGSPGEVMLILSEIDHMVNRDGLYAAGYLTYEAAAAFDPAFTTHEPSRGQPVLWFGLYEAPQIIGPPAPSPGNDFQPGNWVPSISREAYKSAFEQIKEQISEGNTYQVNYTFRLRAAFEGSTWEFFVRLIRGQTSGYAAYLDTGSLVLCSASPELFFHLDGRCLVSRPMKGTLRRAKTDADEHRQEISLRSSEKNRAENLMIVDMVRNDMGRIAQKGSVDVPRLFEIERYPTVLQMTSTVECRTLASIPEILGALFPCASITGAPKIRTMEIIRSIETKPRNVYTGCIGYIGPGRQAMFNIAIRTTTISQLDHCMEYGVGGGVVWDSDCAEEFDECLVKARILPGLS